MRTYRGRTPEEQKAFNKARREQSRQIKENVAYTPFDETLNSEFQPDIQVEPITIPKLSLKDRLLAKLKREDDESPVVAKSEKQHIQRSDNLFAHILPVTLAGLIALYAERLFIDPYKPVSPTQEELSTILLPMFAIFSRYIQISGKASQTAIDVGAILLAIVTISTRMLMTAESIHRNEQEKQRHGITESGSNGYARTEDSPKQGVRSLRDYSASDAEHGNGRNEDVSSSNHGDSEIRDTESEWSASDQVAQLLRRDTYGRRTMGYAPRFI